ncbi:serine/threonine-protein kinase [Streptomyces sp. NPDC126497]|uniref:serine/threonine-protein kinase n=1 Tax=Streptomyces sp. NPDC126497 TaxID=3155313 RepID=UPI00331E13E0
MTTSDRGPMKPGEVLDGRYRLLDELGRGGFGEVWKALDERLQRQVAIKVLFRSAAGAGSGKAAVRFWQEAITVGGLSNEHIVVVHDFGRVLHSGTPHDFLVMEMLHGRPLSQIVSAGVVPVGQVLSWASQICVALDAAHRAGVIHRDLKPQNIIVNEETSRLKVVDFGIAKNSALPLSLTETGAIIGSVMYMAPERAQLHTTVDERSDLYSLGCLLYELLTGFPPFYSTSATPAAVIHNHMQQIPVPPSASREEVPQNLDRLILQLLAKDPAVRPSTAAEVRERLADEGSIRRSGSGPIEVSHPLNGVEAGLRQRVQRAVQAGNVGEVIRAKRLLQDIALESRQLLGGNHPCTLSARREWLVLEAYDGDLQTLNLAHGLVADCEQALGSTHSLTLQCRSLHGHLTDEALRPDRARELLASVIDDCSAHLGAEAVETLEARYWHAEATGAVKDHAAALVLSDQLRYDCQRALGSDHILSLSASIQYALCVANAGGLTAAKVFYAPALSAASSHLGETAPIVLNGRLLWLFAIMGDVEEMAPARLKYELELLLPDVINTYGEDGAMTVMTQALVAVSVAPLEGRIPALRKLASVISQGSARLGVTSLVTLVLRVTFAELTGEFGDAAKARDLMREVQVDLEAAVGADAPFVREVRTAAEKWTAAAPRAGFLSRLKRL